MERDAIIGHGAAFLLLDRLLFNSDAFSTPFCKTCGFIAVPARPSGALYAFQAERAFCSYCQSDRAVYYRTVSYSFKLMLQELMALGCSPACYLS